MRLPKERAGGWIISDLESGPAHIEMAIYDWLTKWLKQQKFIYGVCFLLLQQLLSSDLAGKL